MKVNYVVSFNKPIIKLVAQDSSQLSDLTLLFDHFSIRKRGA